MAILIVDEPEARLTLRRFLGRLGHEVILEARNAEGALKLLEEHRGKVRLLLSDLDLPGSDALGILKTVRANHRWADLMGFLLMSSDLTRKQIAAFDLATPFPDGYLSKPFKFTQFERAMAHAMYRRNAGRDTLLYIGNVGAEFQRIQEALKRHYSHWKQLLYGTTASELDQVVASASGRIGAVLIDPFSYAKVSKGWLGNFRKTALGLTATWVCLGRSVGSQSDSDLRKHCQIFFDPRGTDLEWDALLSKVSRKTLHSWSLENKGALARRAIQKKSFKEAQRHARRMLREDPESSQAHTLLAEVFIGEKNNKEAIAQFRKALDCNPCSPHPYLMLLDIIPDSRQEEREKIAHEAMLFCPNHPYVMTRSKAVLGIAPGEGGDS